MRNALLSLGLLCALTLPVAHGQAPAWTGGVQNTNPTPTDDTQSLGLDISTDAAGNAYVGGTLSSDAGTGAPGTRQFGATTLTGTGHFRCGYLAKVSPALQWQWAVRVSNDGDATSISRVATTPAGDVFGAGRFQGMGSTTLSVGTLTQAITATEGLLVTRLTTTGQPQWIASASLTATGFDTYASIEAIRWDAGTNNLVVVGEYAGGTLTIGSTTLPDAPLGGIFMARLSGSGQWLSAVAAVPAIAATSTGGLWLHAAAVGPQGQLAVAINLSDGTLTLGNTTITSPSASSADQGYAVAEYAANGQWRWVAQPQNVPAGYYGIDDLAYDAAGNLWTYGAMGAGTQLGSATIPANSEAFVARISSAGQWDTVGNMMQQPNSSTSFINASELAIDPQGNAVVTGSIDLQTGAAASYALGPHTLSSNTSRRNFVARLSPAGQWQYAQLAPASSTSIYRFNGVALDAQGNLLTTGYVERGSVTFGPSVLTGSGLGDTYVAKLANAGSLLAVRQAAGAAPLAVYPNPASGGTAATLRLPAVASATQQVVLRDALGRAVAHSAVAAGQQQASLSTMGLAPGLYLLEAGSSRAQLVVE